MDRISRALELSQGERQAKRQRTLEVEQTPHPIRYTITQTVNVSRARLCEHRVLCGLEDPAVFDSYRVLRTRVLQRMAQNGWQALGVTSAGAREGKSLTSVNLAVSLAREHNHTVLLVDADLRRPAVARYLGITPKLGLLDYFENGRPIEDLLIHPGIERLVILPEVKTNEHSSEILSSKKMKALVEEMKARYSSRLVIFDLPPVLAGDDVLAFSPNVDALLLVIEDGSTDADEVSKTIDLLGGINLVGTVLNNSQQVERGEEYYYEAMR